MSGRKRTRPLFPQAAGGDQNGFWFTRTLQQAEMLLLSVLGFLFCLTTSYELDVPTAGLVWSALAFCTLFLIVYSSRRHALLMLLCFAAMVLWTWRNAQDLSQGILLLADQALDPLGLRLPDALQNLLQTYTAQETQALTLLALRAVLFAVTMFSAYFIVRRPSALGLALSTLPLLLPAPFYLLAPGIAPFFCLVSALLSLYILNSASHMPSRILQADLEEAPPELRRPLFDQKQAQQMLALFALPVIVLAALAASWVLPQDGYQRPAYVEALQDKIFSLKFGNESSNKKSNDGLTHGDFRTLSDILFSGETAIKVRISKQRIFYLRDYAGALYTKSGWQDVADRTYESYADGFSGVAPQNLLADAAAASSSSAYETYTLSVKYVTASKTSVWTPCGLVTGAEEIPGASFRQDTALEYKNASGADYTLEALDCGTTLSSVAMNGAEQDADALENAYLAAAGASVNLSGADGAAAQQTLSAAQAYIGYIFETYTALPDGTRRSAEEICAGDGLSLRFEDGALDLYDTCVDLHDYLTKQCAYAYSPPEIPSGEDFAIYFLEESRRGYCVHFASAATVLLRSLGIPARYAEGYIIVPSDFSKQADADGYVEIEDTHAHAWVEVFDPVQLEWIPVEMTASAIRSAEATPDPDAEDTPAPAETPEPTAAPTPEPTATPSAEPSGDPGVSASPDEEGAQEETPSAESEPAASEDEQSGAEQTPTPNPEGEDGSGESDSSADGGEGNGGASGASHPSLWPVIALASAALLALGAFGWRKAAQTRRRRLFFQKDTNAAALAICRFALDVLRFAGCEPMLPSQLPDEYAHAAARRLPYVDRVRLEALLDLAQRARFSGRVVSRQERSDAVSFVSLLAAETKTRLPRLRRWIFYWRCPPV